MRWSVSMLGKLVLCQLLLLGFASPVMGDIAPITSILKATSRAKVDPHPTSVEQAATDTPSPGTLRNLAVDTSAFDEVPPLSIQATANGQLTYAGVDGFTLHVLGQRLGTDSSADEPGGVFQADVSYALSFQAVAAGTISVDCNFDFARTTAGTNTPISISLRQGANLNSHSPQVAFSALSGSGHDHTDFALASGGFYTLGLDLIVNEGSSDLTPEVRWDAVFVVHTPPSTIGPIPEPGTAGYVAIGLGLLALLSGRRRSFASFAHRLVPGLASRVISWSADSCA